MLYCLWEEVVDSLKLQMIMFGSWSSNFFFFAGLSALTTGLKRVESLILAEFSLSLRKEWAALGNMSKQKAMTEFVKLLHRCCHLFSTYVTSHKIEKEEQEKKR